MSNILMHRSYDHYLKVGRVRASDPLRLIDRIS